MGTIRVTPGMLIDRVLTNLNYQQRQLLRLQEQLSTGQRVNRPSDDPMATRRAVAARAVMAQDEQYLTNISTISPYLLETETAVQTVENLRQRAYELTLQGSNNTNGQTQRDQIAIEINSILEDVLSQANHITNGRYIFGGSRTMNVPFVATRNANGEITAVAYQGNAEKFKIEVSAGVQVEVNEIGSEVFQQTTGNSVDIFQTLINIRDALRVGNNAGVAAGLQDITDAQDQLMVSVARQGTTQTRINQLDANLRDISEQQLKVISDNVDADFADVIVNLNAQSNAFQASLNAASRIIQPSLLDFLG